MEYQPRWIIYCDAIGKLPNDATIKNYEYMRWIYTHAEEYMIERGRNVISDQNDFTEWLKGIA